MRKKFLCSLILPAVAVALLMAVLGAGVGRVEPRAPVIYVAASDSSAWARMRAHYRCDGTADQETIEAAIAQLIATGNAVYDTVVSAEQSQTLAGGKIVLAAGSYRISDEIDITNSHVCIEGEGPATTLFNDATDGSHCIDIDGSGETYGLWHVRVKSLRVQGNSSSGDGVHLYKCPHSTLEDVTVVKNGGAGIYIGCPVTLIGADNHLISNCRATLNYGYGIHLATIHETMMTGCHVEENGGHGIFCDAVTNFHLCNCSIEDHGTPDGLHMDDANAPVITGCVFEDSIDITMANVAASAQFSNCTIGSPFTFVGTNENKVFVSGCRMWDVDFSGSIKYCSFVNTVASSTVTLDSSMVESYLSVVGCDFTETSNGTYDFGYARFVGSTFNIGVQSDFLHLSIGNCRVFHDAKITCGPRLQISGCDWTQSTAASIEGSAANISWAINGNSFFLSNTLTLDANGQSNARLAVAGNTFRYAKLDVEDFDHVIVSGNGMQGTSAGTFTNIDGLLTLSNNNMRNWVDFTIDATCDGQVVVAGNSINAGCDLTDNTGSAILTMNSTVGTCTGWGENFADGAIELAEINNPDGDLKLQPDATGDVSLFEDVDVDNASPGKKLHVYRKAAEGDVFLDLFVNAANTCTIQSNSNMLFDNSGYTGKYLFWKSGDDIYFNIGAGDEFIIRQADSDPLMTIDEATGNTTFVGTVNGPLVTTSGATGSRPGSPVTGQMFLDTTLGYPIWYNGSNWVDATGTTR